MENYKKPEHTITYIFYNKDSKGLALTDSDIIEPGVFAVDKELIQMVDWEDVVNAPTAQKRYEFSTEIVNLETMMVSKEKFLSIMMEYYNQLEAKSQIVINTNELVKDQKEEVPFTISDLLKKHAELLDENDSNKNYKK